VRRDGSSSDGIIISSSVISHGVFLNRECGGLFPMVVLWQVKYWVLPYCLAAVDVLQSQNPMAALPHALGILTGEE